MSLLLLTTAVSGWTAGCRRDGAEAAHMPQPPPPAVTVATAIARDVPVYLEAIGRGVPIEAVSIIPQVGGKIVAAPIEDGAYVRKGQLLFEIDPRPFDASLEAARAALAQSKADRELAIIEFNRMKNLMSNSSASPLEFDQMRIAQAVAEAKVEAAQASLEMARLNVEYAKITSPIDGRAGAKLIQAGNVVKANDLPLMLVQRLDPIYAEFTITENDLGTVRKYMAATGLDWGDHPERGLKVEVDIPGDSVRVLAALGTPTPATQPGRNRAGPREGRLTFLDNAVQAGSGVVKLRATVENADHYLWPGQYVNVRLILTTKKNAVLVPAMAQQISQAGPFVYVVKPDGTAELRLVTIGQRQSDTVVIENGVQAGERVIVAGHMAVSPGGPVRVIGDVAASSSAPASHSAGQSL